MNPCTIPAPAVPANLGLGCVTFGREINRADSFAMMDHALAHGISLFDTAAAYGNGASEQAVGQWMYSRSGRSRVQIATKVLPPYSPGQIEASIGGSLERLGTSSVDILFLHRWDETAANDAVLRALDAVVRSGRTRLLGASNFTNDQLRGALLRQSELGVARFQALQNVHNYAVRGIDADMVRLCAQNGIAIMGYSPLGAGFLTGKHEQGVAPGSRFEIIPGHQAVYFNDLARQRLARLKDVASRNEIPMTQLALAWALHQPSLSAVLVGGRTPAHLDQALEARSFSAPEVLRELQDEPRD